MQVSELQTVLKQQGYYVGTIDNLMGPSTIEAIQKFQRQENLTADGKIGPVTLQALQGLTPAAFIPRRASANCELVITSFEGCEDGNKSTVLLDPYIAPEGNATIAWGHLIVNAQGEPFSVSRYRTPEATLEAARQQVAKLFGQPAVTKEQAGQLLQMDINTRSASLTRLLISHSEKPLNQTSAAEFDGVFDVLYNLGQSTLASSTLFRLHEGKMSGAETLVPPILTLKNTSIAALPIETIPDAFCAYSRINHVWTLGLVRRRYVDAIMYQGGDIKAAIKIAMAFS